MANDLAEYLKSHPCVGPFKTNLWYSVFGDFIEYYWEDERAYADGPMWDGVIAMRAFSDHRVVGFKVRRIGQFIAEAKAKEVRE